jgi:hypothetical protein
MEGSKEKAYTEMMTAIKKRRRKQQKRKQQKDRSIEKNKR